LFVVDGYIVVDDVDVIVVVVGIDVVVVMEVGFSRRRHVVV